MGRTKGSKNKKVSTVSKKKVGRPKKTNTKTKKVIKVAKKRGRPKGSKNKASKVSKDIKKYSKKKKVNTYKSVSKYNDLPEDYIPPKNQKFAGYCPKCDMCLTTNDFVSKMVFQCPCGVRKHKKYLKSKSKRQRDIDKVSKQEYLRDAQLKVKHLESAKGILNALPDVKVMGKIEE